jgi:hypothetical protein
MSDLYSHPLAGTESHDEVRRFHHLQAGLRSQRP